MTLDRSEPMEPASVGHNAAVTFIGSVAPLAIVIVTVPIYLSLIGPERYGILALVWVVLDYFGVFGLGLDASTTNHLARHRDDAEQRSEIFWTALITNIVFGALGGLVLYVAGRFLLADLVKASESHRAEISASLVWIACAIPVATVTSVLIAAIQAVERFRQLMVLQFVGSLLFQFIPLGVAYWGGPALPWLVLAAILARVLSGGLFFAAAVSALGLTRRVRFSFEWAKPLLKYGGWVAVTGVVSPLLVSLDRLLIGAALGAAAVAYYTVPFNLVSRLSILSGSLSKALFPRLSVYDRERAMKTSRDAVMSLGVILGPVIVVGIFLVSPFLNLWLGTAFVGNARNVAEILLVGLWINCLAYVPFAFLQAQGRPDLVAKFHLLELGPFVLVLWLGLSLGGLQGAAVAWALRVVVDAILLFGAAGQWREAVRGLWLPTLLVAASLALVLAADHRAVWFALAAAALVVATCAWAFAVAPQPVRNLASALLEYQLRWLRLQFRSRG